MMTPEQLQELRKAYAVNPGATHYEGCASEHTACAVVPLLDEIERLRAENVHASIDCQLWQQKAESLEFISDRRINDLADCISERDAALARVRGVEKEIAAEREALAAVSAMLDRTINQLKIVRSALFPFAEYSECDCSEIKGTGQERCDVCVAKDALKGGADV